MTSRYEKKQKALLDRLLYERGAPPKLPKQHKSLAGQLPLFEDDPEATNAPEDETKKPPAKRTN